MAAMPLSPAPPPTTAAAPAPMNTNAKVPMNSASSLAERRFDITGSLERGLLPFRVRIGADTRILARALPTPGLTSHDVVDLRRPSLQLLRKFGCDWLNPAKRRYLNRPHPDAWSMGPMV